MIIYRVILKIKYNIAFFDFNNIEQACKFADAAMVTNVESEDGKVHVTIELIHPEEKDKDD